MQHISNRVLSEAYEKALELRLEEDFIELLRSEMVRRGMTPSEQTASSRLQLTK
ncbi:sporulation histidine kinase inhibitor Sda [Alteribacillus iranensis]|uniref:Sporulation inhibitor A n=1 Tax=Alteribacillus iranensis TaxID=930128 RepID=A0A1I2EQW6_9BACI|nr:sporulation histidine kinase inhibitor Sda [Alteribacillus iranensis]SFE95093.1 Sporulation inhibitor A [Alteribacillus iranensis]